MSTSSISTEGKINEIKDLKEKIEPKAPLPIFGVAQLTSINNKEANFAACAAAVSQAKAKGMKK